MFTATLFVIIQHWEHPISINSYRIRQTVFALNGILLVNKKE
jgi:hypothetical protein